MLLRLTPAAQDLIWKEWDDVFIIYQPSSAETHVFNVTTALILRTLEQGSLGDYEVRERIEQALGVNPGDLATAELSFAIGRLEELGLVERFNEAGSVDARRRPE